ncbi:LTA synthase family protein [Microbulbifer sp. SA54]|uniref:LTA synthase family protein n=1 Tax=Microbulbifer sp. SA54 TaxID=3401577 RepID=UPI003AB0C2A8
MFQLSLRFLLLSLATLTLWRLGLGVWFYGRIGDLPALGRLLLGGFRIDISLLAMLVALPLLAAPWLNHSVAARKSTAWWYRVWWLMVIFMELVTPEFIAEYDTRPNRLFFEYLVSPQEVGSMLLEGYLGAIFAVVVFTALGSIAGNRILRCAETSDVEPGSTGGRLAVTLACFLLCFLAARGTLQHRPINPALVAFSDDNLVNVLALNSLYSTAYALYSLRHESDAGKRYGKLPEREVIGLVREAAGLDAAPADPEHPSFHRQQPAQKPASPMNLVIIVEESLGARYVGALLGENLTPNLDTLANEGWWFAELYATGTRSVRGLEALVTGFFPTPARAVLKLPRAQRNFFTLADYLGQHGYHSRFVYGGESHFDNMKTFFLGNGFQEIHDLPTFTAPGYVGSWGASDEDMFNELDRLLSQDDKPTFTLAFSVSNHSPWEFPEGRIVPRGERQSRENAIRYADWALGQFFDKARHSKYWDNTLFVVVADHDSRVSGADVIPVEHFHIPALIIGPGIAPKRDERLASQIDLPPTLLSLLGIDGTHPMLGQDLTRQSPDRALMQYGERFGFRTGNQLVVLRPDQPPGQFEIQDSALISRPVSPTAVKTALAHALWPGLAYRHQWYSSSATGRSAPAESVSVAGH